MENQVDNKVLGIPVEKYTKLSYVLMLIASGFSILTYIISLIGIYIPGGAIASLLGLGGLVLAMLGLFMFKESFKLLDISHFKYIGIMFVTFFLIYAIIANALGGFGIVGLLIICLISIAQFAFLFAGYRTFQAGILATKDTILTNVKSGLKG